MLQPTFRGPFRKLLIFEHQELIANVFSSHITLLKYGNDRSQSKNHTFAERTWNTQTLGKKIDWFTKKAFLAYMERNDILRSSILRIISENYEIEEHVDHNPTYLGF